MSGVDDLQRRQIAANARRDFRRSPAIREEFRHDLELYTEHRIRRAGLRECKPGTSYRCCE